MLGWIKRFISEMSDYALCTDWEAWEAEWRERWEGWQQRKPGDVDHADPRLLNYVNPWLNERHRAFMAELEREDAERARLARAHSDWADGWWGEGDR